MAKGNKKYAKKMKHASEMNKKNKFKREFEKEQERRRQNVLKNAVKKRKNGSVTFTFADFDGRDIEPVEPLATGKY